MFLPKETALLFQQLCLQLNANINASNQNNGRLSRAEWFSISVCVCMYIYSPDFLLHLGDKNKNKGKESKYFKL